jgi:hypothetical protein
LEVKKKIRERQTKTHMEREKDIYIYILEMGSKVTLTIVWLGGVICAIEGGEGCLMRAPD